MPIPNASHASATVSVQSNTLTAGGNVTINTTVNSTQSTDASPVSEWLAKFASINQYAIQNATYEKVSPGTCAWILEKPEFEKWISQNSGTRTFWGMGMPGAGKTILASFVIHHLKERAVVRGACDTVAFFYCRYSNDPTTMHVLASLLLQLVEHSTVAAYIEGNLYAGCNKQGTEPTQSAMESTLRSAIGLIPRVFIILDGLDELRDSIRDEVANILVSLECSLFVTSREVDIDRLPRPNVHIRAPDTDLQSFIIREIDRLPKLRSLLKDRQEILFEVVASILRKSAGMFLLSALQMSALDGVTTIKSLRKAIQDLPTTLADMYELTLARINAQSEEERWLALRAILWVTRAVEPLFTKELLDILAVEPDSTTLDPEAITDERTLISVCCGLITTNRKTGVQLIHYTAHDFFMNYRKEPPFDDPHTFAATTCAVYRRLADIDSNYIVDYLPGDIGLVFKRPSRDRRIAAGYWYQTSPFTNKTFRNLGYHTYQSTLMHKGQLPSSVYQFRSEKQYFCLVTPRYSLDRGGAAHFAASHGLLRWFEENPEITPFNQLSDQKSTPFLYACGWGQTSIVDFLLKTGTVDVDVEDGAGKTALDIAVQSGYTPIVELLLNYACFPRDLGALKTAVEGNRVELVQLLLRHPAIQSRAANILSEDSLRVQVSRGNTTVVGLLLACPGMDVNSPLAGTGITPLMCAIEANQGPIVKLLLDLPDINVNVRDDGGSDALHWASAHGRDEVVENILRVPNLDVEAKDSGGRNALHKACMYGNANSLRLLVRSGRMDVNEKDNRGWTPLHVASYSVDGERECIQVLLECRFNLDINAETLKDWWGEDEAVATALDLALQKGHKEIAVLLERAGARRAAEI